MASFADIALNILNYLGIGLIFLFIFYFAVFYALLLFLFKYIDIKGKTQGGEGKKINIEGDKIISLLISISAAFFLTSLSGYYLFTQYFLGFAAALVIIIFFFILMVNIMTNGKFFEILSSPQKNKNSTGMIAIPIFIIVMLIVFIFLAMYYAYQNYFLSLSSGAGLQAQLFQSDFNPYIIFMVFLFVIIGVFIMLSGSGGSKKPE